VTTPGTAGISELAIFHPVDTIAKRLMSNETRVRLSAHEIPGEDGAQAHSR